jgi:hypothetical protein
VMSCESKVGSCKSGGEQASQGRCESREIQKSLACDGLSRANTEIGKREQVVQIDCDDSRDAGESSEGSEEGGCYHERIERNSFWMVPSSLSNILFVAISSMIAVERACIAPCRCFSVCLPSHASIKHSDSRGESCAHTFWLGLCM